jgi:hypothetical protein
MFGEGPGGFVVSGPPETLEALAGSGATDALLIGEVSGDAIEIAAAEASVSVSLAEAEEAWRSLPALAERSG